MNQIRAFRAEEKRGLAVENEKLKNKFPIEQDLKSWLVKTAEEIELPIISQGKRIFHGTFICFAETAEGGRACVVDLAVDPPLQWGVKFYARGLLCGRCGESFEKTVEGRCVCFGNRRDAGS